MGHIANQRTIPGKSLERRDTMDEQWRKIQGFGGVYEISNEARIRSWQKTGTMKSPPQNPKILKHRRNTKGDCFVRLGSKENRKTVLIRNLMRDTWMQGKIPGKIVHNIDNYKGDCSLKNLEYISREKLTGSGRGNRRAVVKVKDGIATDIYRSVREAAKNEFLSPSGIIKRILRGTVVDGVSFRYDK